CRCKAATMLIILMVYQRVANAADAPLSGAPQGGGVNHGNPGKNNNFMQLQTDKVKFPAKPSRIQVYAKMTG
ncbi:MAG: hypothetical protein LC633_03115, partial [Desulfobulbaceae bacterium]|nr:hypothetical protein [Desulfobulbaceae bacterium]